MSFPARDVVPFLSNQLDKLKILFKIYLHVQKRIEKWHISEYKPGKLVSSRKSVSSP